jgi:Ca2+/Na+ antiporter
MADDKAVQESPTTKFAKLLPADLTAAFLSAKAGLIASLGEVEAAGSIFWTFVGILGLSPFYFRYVVKTHTRRQIAFMSATFVVFAVSIADASFRTYLTQFYLLTWTDFVIKTTAIVLPTLWVFLVAPIIMDSQEDDAKT